MREAINVSGGDGQAGSSENDSSSSATVYDYIKIFVLIVFLAVSIISAVNAMIKSDW